MNATNYFTPHQRRLSRLGGLLAAALLLLPPARALAAEHEPSPETFAVVKVGDEIWKNVRVVKATPLELVVKHDGGGSTLKRAELPPELATKYPFDAAEAAAFERERCVVRARDAARQQAAASTLLTQKALRLQAAVDSANEALVQLSREVPFLAAKARGRRANTPERLELDATREKQLGLVRYVHVLQLQLNQVRALQAQLN